MMNILFSFFFLHYLIGITLSFSFPSIPNIIRNDIHNDVDMLSGKHRRILRSIANRNKLNNTIDVIQYNKDSLANIRFQRYKDDNAFKNLEKLLLTKELVIVKLNVEKRKEAKVIGQEIANYTQSNLVQVIGHTLLLYKDNNKLITQQLNKELVVQNNNG